MSLDEKPDGAPTPPSVALGAAACALSLAGFLAGAALGGWLGARWGVVPGLALFFLLGYVGARLGGALAALVGAALCRAGRR